MRNTVFIKNNRIYTDKGKMLTNKQAIIMNAPKTFSFFDNNGPTIALFNSVKRYISCSNCYKLVYNLTYVEKITIDVIMYMIALSIDVRKSKPYLMFTLKLPSDPSVKDFIKKCGLKQFVKGNNEYIVEDCKDYYTIAIGSQADTEITKSICEFVYPHLGIDKSKGFFLYNTFIELMNNSNQHAYKDDDDDKKWFVFIENVSDRLKFTFLDTGVGIPNTVIKKVTYDTNDFNALDLLDFAEKRDARFIYSALLREDMRSQTREENRGHGLPEIYSYYKDGKYTSNLKIISGHGICVFNDYDRLNPKLTNMKHNFDGTLFYWEINKDIFRKENIL